MVPRERLHGIGMSEGWGSIWNSQLLYILKTASIKTGSHSQKFGMIFIKTYIHVQVVLLKQSLLQLSSPVSMIRCRVKGKLYAPCCRFFSDIHFEYLLKVTENLLKDWFIYFYSVWILIQSACSYSPRLDISPILTMCGQCWSVLAKKGFVTPRITPGLKKKMLLLDHAHNFLGTLPGHNAS